MKEKIKIFMVDDHPMVYDGLKLIFEQEDDFEVVGTAQDATSAIDGIKKTSPHLAIIDISLKGSINGLELTKSVRNRCPKTSVLILSMHDESIYAERALRAGARGYLMKHELTSTVIQAIRCVISGKIFLNSDLTEKLLESIYFNEDITEIDPLSMLTDRELEVFQLLGKGYKTNEVAKKLNVSVKTIDTYKARLKEKFKLEKTSDLMKCAVEWLRTNKS